MGDLFDEFKRELERRRAAADGRPHHGEHDGSDEPDAEASHEDDTDDAHDDDADAGEEPVPIRRRAASRSRKTDVSRHSRQSVPQKRSTLPSVCGRCGLATI